MRFFLTIAYDGRPFAGWQSQPGGNGIQDVIEAAAAKISKTGHFRVHAAGRTDSGVHAIGQTAHFDAPEGSKMDALAWQKALNANLPPEIRVLACDVAEPRFHARYDANGKTYRYRLITSSLLLPLDYGRACHLPHPTVDLAILKKAAQTLQGRHDFQAFAATRGDPREQEPGYAVRSLYTVSVVQPVEHELLLEFYGEGFLYKMVRLLTGSLLRVATGKNSLDWLQEHLHAPAGRRTAYVAPAEGLTLVKVHYPHHQTSEA
jgi:tRNA pseudouridine38-40 synthase